MTQEQCGFFIETGGKFNPITGRYIIPQGPTWNRLMSQCRSIDDSGVTKDSVLSVKVEDKASVINNEPPKVISQNLDKRIKRLSDSEIEIQPNPESPITVIFRKGDIVKYQGRGDDNPEEYQIYQFGPKRFEIVNGEGDRKRPKITELFTQNPGGPIIRGWW